jgi:hypothetical protein
VDKVSLLSTLEGLLLTISRLRALVAKRDWNELEEWSKTRKSPIGWEVNSSIFSSDYLDFLTPHQPFYALILSAGNPKLASTFIPKAETLLQPGETIIMYENCGMRVKAAEEAVKIRDVEAVDRLRQAAGVGTVERREIERLGAGLNR